MMSFFAERFTDRKLLLRNAHWLYFKPREQQIRIIKKYIFFLPQIYLFLNLYYLGQVTTLDTILHHSQLLCCTGRATGIMCSCAEEKQPAMSHSCSFSCAWWVVMGGQRWGVGGVKALTLPPHHVPGSTAELTWREVQTAQRKGLMQFTSSLEQEGSREASRMMQLFSTDWTARCQ